MSPTVPELIPSPSVSSGSIGSIGAAPRLWKRRQKKALADFRREFDDTGNAEEITLNLLVEGSIPSGLTKIRRFS